MFTELPLNIFQKIGKEALLKDIFILELHFAETQEKCRA